MRIAVEKAFFFTFINMLKFSFSRKQFFQHTLSMFSIMQRPSTRELASA